MKKDAPELLHIATIGQANGIKGAVSVRCFLSDPMDLGAYGPLSTKDGQTLSLKPLRMKGAAVIATVKGVSDRNGAEALRGTELYLDKAVLPEPDEDEFYYADLIGMQAVDTDGETIGEVVSVQNFGAGDLLEIKIGGRRTEFVPFTREIVPEVRMNDGVLVVAPPPGLLDDGETDQ